MTKLLTLTQATGMAQTFKKKHQKIVFTNGCFDILHAGHVVYLEQAKALGDILMLGLNSDVSIKLNKGANRPIVPEEDRIIIMSALNCIDYVVLFDDKTPETLISHIQPDIHVKGGDYQAALLPEYPLIQSYGGQVVILPFLPNHSTTDIVQRCQNLTN